MGLDLETFNTQEGCDLIDCDMDEVNVERKNVTEVSPAH